MRDLPLHLIGRSIGFVVSNLFTLFRLCWFPIAVLLAAQAALGQALATIAGGTSKDLLEASPFSEPATWLSAVLQTIALSVVAVRVHRLVLFDDRRPGHYFLFAFGRTEALYVAMVVLLIAGVFAILAGVASLVLVVNTRSVGEAGGDTGEFIETSLKLSLVVASIFLSVWFALRMSLWPVVVVAKGGLAPVDAWRLTRRYATPLFWMFFIAQFVLMFALSIAAIVSGNSALMSPAVFDRHLSFGGWLNPNVLPYASSLTAERLAIDFGLSFFVTAFMASLLSFTFLEVNQEQAAHQLAPI